MRVEQGQPVAGKLIYRAADYAFDTEPAPTTCGASFAVNELQLMLDDEEQQRVVSVEGYCPYPGWRPAVLRPPVARAGILRGAGEGRVAAGSAIGVNSTNDRWPVLVDPAAGWVRVGKGDPDEDCEGVEFAPGAIAVLEEDRLRALWLHPDRLPALSS